MFMKVPHDLFKFTTAEEHDSLGGSVGADRGTAVPRAATHLTRAIAATGDGGHPRGAHLEARTFIKRSLCGYSSILASSTSITGMSSLMG